MIRIVMADDHAIVRAGFRALIEDEPGYEIVAECSGTEDTRTVVLRLRPDVLVLDLSLPGGGLSVVPELRAALPAMAILVLTMHEDESYVAEAFNRGVHGYVTKGAAPHELFDALRAVRAGERYLSRDLRSAAPSPGLGVLTPREHDVFVGLARGLAPKQIAYDLGISRQTVYQHREAVRAKLGLRNDLEMHRIALVHGVLPAGGQGDRGP
jgi:two-component system uhpT operon response regulator UhpA